MVAEASQRPAKRQDTQLIPAISQDGEMLYRWPDAESIDFSGFFSAQVFIACMVSDLLLATQAHADQEATGRN